MNNQKKMGNKGFSLVELIVVIAIMAVLVGVLAPQFLRYVEKSRQDGDITSIQQVMTAINTGVSDGVIKGDVTITINADKLTVAASGTGATLGTALTDSGLSESMDLKSNGWPSATIKYTAADSKWTIPDATNTKKPSTNLNALNPSGKSSQN